MITLSALSQDPAFRHEALKAFLKGLGFVAVLLVMLAGWSWMRADDTLARWQERFPSKTVTIQAPVTSGLSDADRETPAEEPAATPPVAETQTPVLTQAPAESRFNQFRKAVTLEPGKARLAVVLTDAGISGSFTKTLIERLPSMVTLGFSPYAEQLGALKQAADDKGFESWLMLPLEPANYPAQDSGPLTVRTNASLESTQDDVGRLIAIAGKGYVGFVTDANHVFGEPDLRTNPAMRMIAEKGFGFIEGRSQGNAFAKDFSAQNYIPYAQAGEWLHRNTGRADIQATLQRVEKLAQLNGSAILMVETTPLSLQLLQEWLEKLPGRNIQMVPVSALAQ